MFSYGKLFWKYSGERTLREGTFGMSRRLSLTIFVLDIAILLVFTLSRWHVVIDLAGPEELTVPYGQEYTDPGARAQIQGKDIAALDGDLDVRTKGEVDTSVPGEYTVDYSASRLFYHGKASRTVRVVDEIPPELTLGPVQTELDEGQTWEDAYSAWDNCDGDLTASVQVRGGPDMSHGGIYTVEYTVTDSSGNTASAQREVTVYDVAEPVTGPKIIFLTFDDGPCANTDTLLEILDRYDVKVTFFVTGNGVGYLDCIGKEAAAGHTVAVHSLTHDWDTIYQNEANYWADFEAMNDIIEEYTGQRSRIFRFPGGASNTISSFNPGIMTRLTEQAHDMGLEYFDWNVDVSDGAGGDTREGVFQNFLAAIGRNDVSVVLCHDTHLSNVLAAEDIIQWGLENGYTFLPLQKGITVCHHGVNN